MSQLVGNIEAFSEATTWSEYKERFDTFLAINRVDDEKAKSMYLVTFGGPILYAKMRNIVSPNNPAAMRYSDLVAQLNAIIIPRTQQMLERAVFYERIQKPGKLMQTMLLLLNILHQHASLECF